MGFPPSDKTFEGLLRDNRERLDLLERRLIGSSSSSGTASLTRGTTAERNSTYGVPATAAEQALLANKVVEWFNTDKGWTETYYAVTGTAGLVALGLIAGTASGWFPAAGSVVMGHKGKASGSQAVSGLNWAEVTMTTAQIRRGGVLEGASTSALRTPFAGLYRITSGVFWSGTTAAVNQLTAVRINNVDSYNARVYRGANADATAAGTWTDNLVASAEVTLWVLSPDVSASISGAGNRSGYGTFVELEYLAPPLVNS